MGIKMVNCEKQLMEKWEKRVVNGEKLVGRWN